MFRIISSKESILVFLGLIFFLSFSNTELIAQGTKPKPINLNEKHSFIFNQITIRQSLMMIEKKINIEFAFNESLKQLNTVISKNYSEKSLQFILNEILIKNGLSYKVIGNKVTLYNPSNRKSKVRVSGYIFDAKTGEALIGCTLYYKEFKYLGTTSNQFGYFALTIKNNGAPKQIQFSYIGYDNKTITLSNNDTIINVRLEPSINQLHEFEVNASQNENEQRVESSEMGTIKISAKEIKGIPAVGGEADVLKSITVLPGIKPGVDGSSGFYVRGGSIDQNLILLDGVPIYNPYHMWGYLSSFNADAINDVTVTKGAFPARYGGRLSSVVDITTKEGNNQNWSGDFTLGLLSAKASISGPLVKNKGAIMFTARRTYADLIIVPILTMVKKKTGYSLKQGYNFTDLNLKLNYQLSKSDRIFLNGFLSRDKYYFEEKQEQYFASIKTTGEKESTQGWGNAIVSLRWNHNFKKNLFLNTTAYYSSYNYYTTNLTKRTSDDATIVEEKESSVGYKSNISDFALKQDYQISSFKNQNIRFGASGIYHIFTPGVTRYLSKTGSKTKQNSSGNIPINSIELSAYIEDDWDLSKRIRVNGGIHFSSFFVENQTYKSLQPRISARVKINNKMAIKAGYSQMTQYMHLLTSSGITQSSDLWVPSTQKVRPQQSTQVSLGLTYAISKTYLLEVESYYKTMTNVIAYMDGSSFLDPSTGWEDKITAGNGTAYGVEVFFKKSVGQLTGFLGYTLSWSNRKFDEINFGKQFPFRYDRRHDFAITGEYKLNKKWTLNSSWTFYTGNAVTVPTHSYITPNYGDKIAPNKEFPDPYTIIGFVSSNGKVTSAPSRNNYRLPNYHRLDITASYTKQKKWGEWKLVFGVTNLYNKMNPSFYYTEDIQNTTTGEVETKYYQRTMFPIMPTISYQIKL